MTAWHIGPIQPLFFAWSFPVYDRPFQISGVVVPAFHWTLVTSRGIFLGGVN